jgi:hypothetical protein
MLHVALQQPSAAGQGQAAALLAQAHLAPDVPAAQTQ